MRAIIIATDHHSDSTSMIHQMPAVLLPLVDRPFIQHVVEYLVDQGISEFDFILSHMPEKIENLFGDGSRWGSRFSYHLVRDASRPYRTLKTICREGDPILLAHADRLPLFPVPERTPSSANPSPVLLCSRNGDNNPQWTGWGWISEPHLSDLPDDAEMHEFADHLMSKASDRGELIEVISPLSVERYDLLLDSQSRLLSKEVSNGLILSGRETDDGIWLSRNVVLHPTARIVPPVHIGQNCRIGQGAQIGPNAVVNSDCVLDARCSVVNSLVLRGSFVGEALELGDAIVDKNLLLNVRVGVMVSVADNFILGSIAEKHFSRLLASTLSRIAAIALLIATWPVLLLTALILKLGRRGPVVNNTDVVILPAPPREPEWRTFKLHSFQQRKGRQDAISEQTGGIRGVLLCFLPALVNIAKGELRFVGLAPRTKEQILTLPSDWQSLYLHSKAGLITEAYIQFGASPTEDELYSVEAYYAVTAGVRRDLRLLFRYIIRVLKDSFSRSLNFHSEVSRRRDEIDARGD